MLSPTVVTGEVTAVDVVVVPLGVPEPSVAPEFDPRGVGFGAGCPACAPPVRLLSGAGVLLVGGVAGAPGVVPWLTPVGGSWGGTTGIVQLHGGGTQFGGVPVVPGGHTGGGLQGQGTTQFGGVPVVPGGHTGCTGTVGVVQTVHGGFGVGGGSCCNCSPASSCCHCR